MGLMVSSRASPPCCGLEATAEAHSRNCLLPQGSFSRKRKALLHGNRSEALGTLTIPCSGFYAAESVEMLVGIMEQTRNFT